jgi:5'-nucleotidase
MVSLSAEAHPAMSHPYRSWTRRDFLKVASRAGLLGACPTLASAAAAVEPDTVCISILHTTDLHGHILPTFDYDGTADRGGLARCVTQIRRWRKQNPNSMLIDVGDVYQGTDVSLRNKGDLMVDLFNQLKYDAWVIGNHEFDWGIEPFTDALQKSAMPVLGANTILDGKSAGSLIRNIRSQRSGHLSLGKLRESKSPLSESPRQVCRFGFHGSLPVESIFSILLSLCVAQLRK